MTADRWTHHDPAVRELIRRAQAEATARAEAAEALAETFAYEHAATIDGEWGCCHDEDALKVGGRAPLYDGDDFDPIPDTCPGKRNLDHNLARLRAALADEGDTHE